MKISVLVLLTTFSPAVCLAEDPAPVKPTPTPRVIILHHENMRKSLEKERMSLDRGYSAGKIDRGSYDKGIKEYKAGIDKYREEVRKAGGADKSGSKAAGEKKAESPSSSKK
jgi:hypothetical protein